VPPYFNDYFLAPRQGATTGIPRKYDRLRHRVLRIPSNFIHRDGQFKSIRIVEGTPHVFEKMRMPILFNCNPAADMLSISSPAGFEWNDTV